MTLTDRLSAFQPQVLAALRIMTALLFIQHGAQILFNFPDATKPVEGFLPTLHSFGGMMEVFGGALIVLGLFTRPVAFLLSGEMAYAYFTYHAGKSFYPILNAGDSCILFTFVFLYLVFAGPGAFALDNMRRSSSARRIIGGAAA